MTNKEKEKPNKDLRDKSKSKRATDEYKALQATLIETVEQVLQDAEVFAESEEFHKKATSISPEKLLRPFDT